MPVVPYKYDFFHFSWIFGELLVNSLFHFSMIYPLSFHLYILYLSSKNHIRLQVMDAIRLSL